MSTLQRLQSWYTAQCNDEWEHYHGLTIESCDNPGWWVKIDLTGTALNGMPFTTIAENVDSHGFQLGNRWILCHLNGPIWEGTGDESRLEQILELFLDWAEKGGKSSATHS